MQRTIQDGSGETDWAAIGKSLKNSVVEDDLFNKGESTRPLCTSEVRLLNVVEVIRTGFRRGSSASFSQAAVA